MDQGRERRRKNLVRGIQLLRPCLHMRHEGRLVLRMRLLYARGTKIWLIDQVMTGLFILVTRRGNHCGVHLYTHFSECVSLLHAADESPAFFSNFQMKRDVERTILDSVLNSVLHSNDHFESHRLGNGLHIKGILFCAIQDPLLRLTSSSSHLFCVLRTLWV